MGPVTTNESQVGLVSNVIVPPRRLSGSGLGSDLGPDSSSTSSSNRFTKRQLLTVSVLCFVNLINYMDRFTLAGKSLN
jgi:hypothetical protein